MIVVISLYADLKSTYIHPFLSVYHDFRNGADLCKSGKEYLNEQTCKFYFYSIHDCKTFDISNVFLPTNITKLQKLKYPC